MATALATEISMHCLVRAPYLLILALLALASIAALAERAGAAKPPEPPAPVRLPILYEEHRFFVQPITRDGVQLTLFTDTGGGLFITAAAVERLKLGGLTAEDLGSRGISIPAAVIREMPPGARFVQLPEFRADASIPAPITPWGESFLLPHAPVAGSTAELVRDGMLGQMWFAGRVWMFDYANRELLLHPPGDLREHEPEQRVDLGFKTADDGRRLSNHPRMPITIDGETIQVLFDTGATTVLSEKAMNVVDDGGGSVRATSFIAERIFNQWRKRNPGWRVIEAAETSSGQAMIEARDVTIAGHAIDAVWFTRRTDNDYTWMSSFMDQPVEGALGGNALRHFRITVDYPRAVAIFEYTGPR
jgi:hypothetical protein